MLKRQAILIAFVLMCACAARADAVRVKVNPTAGETLMRTTESADWVGVKKQTEAGENAWIKTGKESGAVVSWGRGHSVKIGPLSLVKINQLVVSDKENTETTEIEIKNGRCVAKVNKLQNSGSAFTIKTPSGISGVRGTAFAVEVAEDGASQFTAIEDTIFVLAQDVEIVLEPGWEVAVEPDMPPGEPEQIPPEALQELENEVDEFAPDTDDAQGALDEDTEGDAADDAVDAVEDIIDDIPVDEPQPEDHPHEEQW